MQINKVYAIIIVGVEVMKDPLTRLFYYGIIGIGISIAMLLENYISKSNSTLEYAIGIILLIFSIFFIISGLIIKRRNK